METQKVPIVALVAHLLLWKSVSIVAARNIITQIKYFVLKTQTL